jgi:hypothetical protein
VHPSPDRPGLLLLPTLAALLLAGACTYVEDPIGHVEAQAFELPECEVDTPLTFSLNALAFDACADLLHLRAQDSATPTIDANGLEIQFSDLPALQEALASGPVTRTVEGDGVRAGLFLNRTCPDSFVPLQAASGTVTIESLDLDKGGDVRLHGTFAIVDARDNSPVSPELSFELDTSDSGYRPTRDYPVCP